MSERYLDINKSVIVSSPAGSGKTEKLARRYISLLERGSDVEKVLCITFTEKAAAEMKQRILSILEREHPELLSDISLKIPLMRISTIHAFCLRLLKRFSVELGMDPSLSVTDDIAARELWTSSVYGCLIEEHEKPSGFFHTISRKGIKGWDSVQRALEEIHRKRPYPELLLRSGKPIESESANIFSLYVRCLEKYSTKKREKNLVDYEDLELMAYEALSCGQEWHNILYAFDEHTDHILLDEFQDTSTLQWKIIEKLTEEWRSGIGAKRDSGKTPTIFLVGDEKQSIYRFRGANVSVFHHAKEIFRDWLGGEFHFVESRENYRSLPAIVDFVNRLFSRIMPGGELLKSWMTNYTPFMPIREGEGAVELLLLNPGDNTKDTRTREAKSLANSIKALYGSHEIFGEDGVKRPCRFEDMAVLLRKRTHLELFEDAMRREGIPFVILKGIGFYDAPEVAALRELLSFIVDPTDDFSLIELLRSPLFSTEPNTLLNLARGKIPVMDRLRELGTRKMRETVALLDKWIAYANEESLSVALERALTESGAWSKYWEPQRHANIKKFIALVESFEDTGLSPLEIREKLIRQRLVNEVPKANINAEGMDAVRILTIHAAKGLQFPMVFLPSLDESITPRTGPVVVDDEDGDIRFLYEEDSAKRNKIEIFRMNLLKEQEEEKRLFYVAVTRARDYLMMLGSLKDGKPTGRLALLSDAFEIMEPPERPLPFKILREDDLRDRSNMTGLMFEDVTRFVNTPAYTEPILYTPKPKWRDVTEETGPGHGHGEQWVVVGRVMHKLFEEISRGTLKEKDITERLRVMLTREAITDGNIMETVLGDVLNLSRVGLLNEIILPARNSYTELPFILDKGDNIYKGRIDRVIIKTDRAELYDYKTFPVRESEIPELVEKYGFQMRTYKEAVEKLFKLKTKSYLLFTHLPRVVEV